MIEMPLFKTEIKFINAPPIDKNHRTSQVSFFSHLQLMLFSNDINNKKHVRSFRYSSKHAELNKSNLNSHPIVNQMQSIPNRFIKRENCFQSSLRFGRSTNQDLRIHKHFRSRT